MECRHENEERRKRSVGCIDYMKMSLSAMGCPDARGAEHVGMIGE